MYSYVCTFSGEMARKTLTAFRLDPNQIEGLRINLHVQDLGHEAGSRFLEAGVPPHHVREMLGHADLKTTDGYLNVTATGLQESMRKMEATAPGCKPAANAAHI
jgi:site-specific recombinase XerD